MNKDPTGRAASFLTCRMTRRNSVSHSGLRDGQVREPLTVLDIAQQKMVKSTGVLIGNDLNYVQFNSQIANTMQEETTSINSRRDASDFNMPIDGNEQGTQQ